MKKTIAYIGIKALPANAGVDTVVENIVTRLDSERYSPVVYVDRNRVSEDTRVPGVHLVRVRTIPGKYFGATSLYLFAALDALFMGHYDLVNVHSVETCFILPLLRLRYKVVSTAHGLLSKEPDDLSKWGRAKSLLRLTELPFMHFSNVRTSVSKPDKVYLESRYKKPVYYLPNGIDEPQPDLEKANALLAEHGLEPGKYMIFTAGRIVPRKGCHFVLEAMRHMDEDIKLLVVGDTSHVPEYTEQLKSLADDRVRFCGFISDKSLLFGLIKLSHLFLFPTTYEAMAITLLEVSALRTPLIASDIPENREVLPEQALFFKSGDASDLREKMRWALTNPDEMVKMAEAASVWVAENYRWPSLIDQYERLYDTLLEDSQPSLAQNQSQVARGEQ